MAAFSSSVFSVCGAFEACNRTDMDCTPSTERWVIKRRGAHAFAIRRLDNMNNILSLIWRKLPTCRAQLEVGVVMALFRSNPRSFRGVRASAERTTDGPRPLVDRYVDYKECVVSTKW